MSYYVFAWNETDRSLKIACLCSEIFSVCVSLCECDHLWPQCSPSRSKRGALPDNKCCLLSVCFDKGGSEGQGLHSGSSLLILCVSQRPFEEPHSVSICEYVSVCVCVLSGQQ